MGVGGQRRVPTHFTLPPSSGIRPATSCIGGRVGPRTGLDRCGKSRPTRIWSSDRPSRSESVCRIPYPCRRHKDWLYRNGIVAVWMRMGDAVQVMSRKFNSTLECQFRLVQKFLYCFTFRVEMVRRNKWNRWRRHSFPAHRNMIFFHYIYHLNEWPY